MEHNRLAEEGYYLAIPSGRTKNFILSKREREPSSYHSAFSLLLASSCSFSFSCRFSFLTSTCLVCSGTTQPDAPLSRRPLPPLGFSSVHPSAKDESYMERGCFAAASPRQQSKIKIQKSAGGKNRRKLDKSRPASAFFAHLPWLTSRAPSYFFFIQVCGERPGGREGRPISSGRLTPESQTRVILFGSGDDNNNRGVFMQMPL